MSKTVFVDLGANKGQSIVKAQKGILKGKEYQIYSFETLPFLANALKEYFEKDDNIEIIHSAAWIEDTEIKFYVSEKSTESGTVVVEKYTGGIDKDKFIYVPAINFSDWCLENLNEEDTNILKFDVEGAEYEILFHLIKEGTFNLFSSFLGEFHKNKMSKLHPEHQIKVNFVEQYFRDKKINFKKWEAGGSMGIVDYKKGTSPSLESSKILKYDKDGSIITYNL